MELPELNNKGSRRITLLELEEIINKLEPLEKEVKEVRSSSLSSLPLPDKQLLSKEFYPQLLDGYINYMKDMLSK